MLLITLISIWFSASLNNFMNWNSWNHPKLLRNSTPTIQDPNCLDFIIIVLRSRMRSLHRSKRHNHNNNSSFKGNLRNQNKIPAVRQQLTTWKCKEILSIRQSKNKRNPFSMLEYSKDYQTIRMFQNFSSWPPICRETYA